MIYSGELERCTVDVEDAFTLSLTLYLEHCRRPSTHRRFGKTTGEMVFRTAAAGIYQTSNATVLASRRHRRDHYVHNSTAKRRQRPL